jgi:hypothetical protein
MYPGEDPMIVRAILEWDDEAQSYSATCRELNFVSSSLFFLAGEDR